jgi:hypothetical protein
MTSLSNHTKTMAFIIFNSAVPWLLIFICLNAGISWVNPFYFPSIFNWYYLSLFLTFILFSSAIAVYGFKVEKGYGIRAVCVEFLILLAIAFLAYRFVISNNHVGSGLGGAATIFMAMIAIVEMLGFALIFHCFRGIWALLRVGGKRLGRSMGR